MSIYLYMCETGGNEWGEGYIRALKAAESDKYASAMLPSAMPPSAVLPSELSHTAIQAHTVNE
jgi:hypothetical protein